LHKHASWKKIVVASARIVVGDWYYNKESTCVKNERFKHTKIVINKMQSSVRLSFRNKIVQCATIFHLLSHRNLMFEYETFKELFSILKVKNNLKKHWTNGSGWGMAKAMHDVVLTSIRANVQVVSYFSMSANETITLDNQQWINVHVYVTKD
jgi:hypothetical protein